MSDAEIVASIRGGIISHSHLKRIATLAENYLLLRDETSHLEFTARGVHYYTGDERSLDAAVEAARKGGET